MPSTLGRLLWITRWDSKNALGSSSRQILFIQPIASAFLNCRSINTGHSNTWHETMAKLDVVAWERSKGQIQLSSGRELESHYRHGMCAHYLPFKDTEDNLQHLQMCTLSSSEAALGSNTWEHWFPWKVRVKVLRGITEEGLISFSVPRSQLEGW